jgi:hypothetical protein
VTRRLLTPWSRRKAITPGATDAQGSTAATTILDWKSEPFVELGRSIVTTESGTALEVIRAAHVMLSKTMTPVYSLDDRQPASQTLRRGRGSCSQRMAVLEAFARSQGIKTRVRGLLVDGRFWYPRFPLVKFAVPREVILAWPEFKVDDNWTSFSELFGDINQLAASGLSFTNKGAETLFDAVSTTAVDWEGSTSISCPASGCDLSSYVVRDLGRFSSRDELFDLYGETMCGPLRAIANPLLSRWSARS